MDFYCPRCGTPWYFDELQREARERYGVPIYGSEEARRVNPAYDSRAYEAVFNEVRKEFWREGCGTFKSFGIGPCAPAGD